MFLWRDGSSPLDGNKFLAEEKVVVHCHRNDRGLLDGVRGRPGRVGEG